MKILMQICMQMIMKNYFYHYTTILPLILSFVHLCSAINGSTETSTSFSTISRCKRQLMMEMEDTFPPLGPLHNLTPFIINSTAIIKNESANQTIQPNHIHRLELSNIELMQFDFKPFINDHYLITSIIAHNILYIGSVNQIFSIAFKEKTFDKFHLNNCDQNLSNRSNVFCNGKYELMFAYDNITAADGPHPMNRRCQPYVPIFEDSNFHMKENGEVLSWDELIDNQIVHLFYYNRIIFSCGTARCGLCTGFAPDLSTARLFATEIPNYQQRLETYFDPYLKPVNFISSFASSILFFGHYHNANVIYTAFSPDGRDPELNVPFITSRVLQSKKVYQNGKPTIVTGFNYTRYTKNDRSAINLEPSSDYQFKFLTGFSYKRFAYFLFMEYNQDAADRYGPEIAKQWPRLRLGRLCEDDPTSLLSYIETTLECNKLRFASTAHLTIQLNATKKSGRYILNDNTENLNDYLLIGFNNNPNGSQENIYSNLCAYSLADIDHHFTEGFINCKTTHSYTKLNEKFIKEGKKHCRIDETRYESYCQFSPINKFIDIEKPLLGKSLVQFNDDHLTSIGAVCVHTYNEAELKFERIFYIYAGTSKSLLYRFIINNNHIHRDVVIKLPEPILPQQNITIILSTATMFLLTKQRLIHYPITSCSLYSTCSTCFASRNHSLNNYCYWLNGKCHWNDDLKNIENLPLPTCPPVIDHWGPKSGPTSGGTVMNFYGENFGNRWERQPTIYIGKSFCKVTLYRDNHVSCNIMDSNSLESLVDIKFTAVDDRGIATRKFFINGTVTIEKQFHFYQSEMYGIHPWLGPYSGGTIVLIFGKQLNIGSNLEVAFGDMICTVLTKNVNYIICKTEKFGGPTESILNNYPRSVNVKIDNEWLILNQNDLFHFSRPLEILGNKLLKFNKRDTSTMDNSNQTMDNFVLYTEQNDEYYQKLFQFRFKKFIHKNQHISFNKKFSYHPDPHISLLPQDMVYSNKMNMEFFGTNLSSVLHPELELIFPGNKHVLCTCDFYEPDALNQLESLNCSLPSSKLINLTSPVDFTYKLHLDGIIYNSTIPLKYYLDPEIYPNETLIFDQNGILEIHGKNLHPNLPYTVLIDQHQFKCLKIPPYAKDGSFFKCQIKIPEEIMNKISGKYVNVTAKLGQLKTYVGQMKFNQQMNRSFFITVAIGIAVMMLLFIIIILKYIRQRQHKHYDPVDLIELNFRNMDINELIRKHFDEAFPEDTEHLLYNEMLSNNKILTDINRLEVLNEMGSGQYGCVYAGRLDSNLVAVKISKGDDNPLMQEMKTMNSFNHRNIMPLMNVTIVKVHSAIKLAIIVPYMHKKDLHSFVRNPANEPTLGDIIDYSIQIANGMEYLSRLLFVHRDLAARNCLIDEHNCVKIGDFGLSRHYCDDKQYYKVRNMDNPLPTKWMALESLETFHFTSKSDVWSYGVLVWELFTRGRVPYENRPSDSTFMINYLKMGHRLERPSFIPEILWLVIARCWVVNPNERPTFQDLVVNLNDVVKVFREKRADLQRNVTGTYLNTPHEHFNFNQNHISQRLYNNYQTILANYRSSKLINNDALYGYENLSAFPNRVPDNQPLFKTELDFSDDNLVKPYDIIIDEQSSQVPPPYIEVMSPELEIQECENEFENENGFGLMEEPVKKNCDKTSDETLAISNNKKISPNQSKEVSPVTSKKISPMATKEISPIQSNGSLPNKSQE